METAQGGQEALEKLARHRPFAVVVSDLRMPGMDGIEFLTEVRRRAPDTVRVMLTGYADVDAAVAAVNEGSIFRFLTKPVEPEPLRQALDASVAQHRLITAEHAFMEETLGGSLKLLTDVLALLSPAAFSRTRRIRRFVRHVAQRLELPKAWQLKLAADLSQIGCITMPPAMLDKIARGEALSEEEQTLFASHPAVGSKLIGEIPRLGRIAQMVARQQLPFRDCGAGQELCDRDSATLGAQILHVAHDLEQRMAAGATLRDALGEMRQMPDEYDPTIVDALESLQEPSAEAGGSPVDVGDLVLGMVLAEDVRGTDGIVVATEGQEVTPALLERLQRLERVAWVEGPIRVRPSQAV